MADDFRPTEDDRAAPREQAKPARYSRSGRRIMTMLVAIAAVLGFGVVLLYAYNKGKQEAKGDAPPVIQAKEGPTKVRPESPGGMKVPDRDKEVFSRMESEEQPGRVEQLLPPPEKPLTPPAPEKIPEQMAKMAPAAGTTAQPAQSEMPQPPPVAPQKEDVKPPKVSAAKAPAPVVKKPVSKSTARSPKKVAGRTPAAGGHYRIQISSLRSEAALRKSWAGLQKRHGDLLGKLSLIVEKTELSGGRGTYYRMQAGKLASRDTAKSLCARLKQRKLSCIVVRR